MAIPPSEQAINRFECPLLLLMALVDYLMPPPVIGVVGVCGIFQRASLRGDAPSPFGLFCLASITGKRPIVPVTSRSRRTSTCPRSQPWPRAFVGMAVRLPTNGCKG